MLVTIGEIHSQISHQRIGGLVPLVFLRNAPLPCCASKGTRLRPEVKLRVRLIPLAAEYSAESRYATNQIDDNAPLQPDLLTVKPWFKPRKLNQMV